VKKPLCTALLCTFCTLTLQAMSDPGSNATAPAAAAPQTTLYTADGRLKFPADYREWIYLSSGLDMSYRDRGGMQGHSMFDNVFANPAAYREFLKTGTWPNGTLLAMEVRAATEKGSINQSGKFQSGDQMGVEVHVKDARFAGGWAFFAFGDKQPAAQIPTAAECYSCHRDHAAVDTTFVQFYPTLLSIARQQGTVKPGTL
jgi:hypothetical protein